MIAITRRTPRIRVPDLGPRGEGWVALRAVLFLAVIATGFAGPAWAGPVRTIGILAGLALIEDGAFGVVRHPMYGGVFLFAVGLGLLAASVPTLLCALLLALFFDLKSRREEAWLGEAFPTYADYRRRTPRLVPWIH